MARYPVKNFIAQGICFEDYYRAIELQISEDGSCARYRVCIGSALEDNLKVFYGHWQEIRYSLRKGPYIRAWYNYSISKRYKKLYLDNFLRAN